jgi:hypothetical protein
MITADPQKSAGRAYIFLVELERERRLSSVEAEFLRAVILPLVVNESNEDAVAILTHSGNTVN